MSSVTVPPTELCTGCPSGPFIARSLIIRISRNAAGVRRFGFAPLLCISLAAALAVILGPAWKLAYYQEVGGLFYWRAAVLGFPCWLLGVALAERFSANVCNPSFEMPAISRWRLSAWLLQAPLLILAFQGIVGTPVTLTIFAFFGFVWLTRELRHAAHQEPPRWSERFGRASYSLYLIHPAALFLADRVINQVRPGFFCGWAFSLALTGAVTTVFYFTTEAPSHRLSRRVSKMFLPSPDR